jgi:hypothetical protein
MRPSDTEEPSRIIGIYEQLRKLHPNWYVKFGKRAGGGWIPGKELQEPDIGAFNALLARIGAITGIGIGIGLLQRPHSRKLALDADAQWSHRKGGGGSHFG